MAYKSRTYDPDISWDPSVEAFFNDVFGETHSKEIKAALSIPPKTTSLRVNPLTTNSEAALARLLHVLEQSPEESAMLSAQPYIHPLLSNAIMIPGSGPHNDIDYSKCNGREVVVGRLAGEAVLQGSHVFIPGTLAASSKIEKGDLVAVSVGLEVPNHQSGPLFGMSRGTILGSDAESNCLAPARDRLYIGIAVAELSRNEMFKEAKGVALRMVERVFKIPSFFGPLRQEMMLQRLPSIVVAQVLNPLPGSRVLDMCASPGGKTTALAEVMGDVGEIIAIDRTKAKAVAVARLAQERQIKIVKAMKMDATKAADQTRKDIDRTSQKCILNDKIRKREATRAKNLARQGIVREQIDADSLLSPSPPCFELESFDYILVDAPCSALGLRPRLHHSHDLKELKRASGYQRNFLESAVALLKPGGYLVFSTCTINPLENEGNVRWLLDKYKGNMILVQQSPRLGGPGLTVTVRLPDEGRERALLTPEEAAIVQRFDPSSQLDTNGFFIAKFQKVFSK